MKNALAIHKQEAYDRGFAEGCLSGQDFTIGLMIVALNNLFGFGRDRIIRAIDEINRLKSKEFGGDKEAAAYQLAKRIKQIMGEK